MFKKILIANRGEIAVRIIRTARRLGVGTVAVVSEADRGAPFAALADEAVEIGPGPATESYLRVDKIIAAAKQTGADGIHPGYGFLAENADFAEAVGKAGLKFIGPSPDAMRRMGGKAEAKAIAAAGRRAGGAGLPGRQPGRQGARQEAKRIGYPVMIKAVAGGGGRGMRLVERDEDFAAALESAQREAQAAFGDARVLLEKVVARPRHIEVQVFGDAHGNVVHLFERDCSLQRRNQKVIEEAPAPGMSAGAARQDHRGCRRLRAGRRLRGRRHGRVPGRGRRARARGPLVLHRDEHAPAGRASGDRGDHRARSRRMAAARGLAARSCRSTQAQIRMSGHAIEARLNAEDPAKGFLPSTGPIVAFETPELEGLRVDAGVEKGSVISPFYDSMIAKLIAAGADRDAGHRPARARRWRRPSSPGPRPTPPSCMRWSRIRPSPRPRWTPA